MNTKYLVTLKEILKTGSFKGAAEKLNYTQSTVTFQMRQLEEELSIKLFEKIGRNMKLTQAGKDILPFVDSILEGIEQINDYGKDLTELTGTLSLAIPDSILIYTMQPFIQKFTHEAPNVQLLINSMLSEEVNSSVANGFSDIGINCEKESYPDCIEVQKLGTYKTVLIASPFSDSKLHNFLTPHQTKPISLICNEPEAFYQLDFEKYLIRKDISLKNPMKVQSIEAVKKCVMNNLGIAIVPTYSVEEELKNGSLVQIETELDDKIYDSFYIFNKNRWKSPQTQLALKLLNDTHKINRQSNK